MPAEAPASPLAAVADDLDILAGCTPRSVLALEASWAPVAEKFGITWAEAYAHAQSRAALPAHDRDGGQVVAMLEGMLTLARLAVPPTVPSDWSAPPRG